MPERVGPFVRLVFSEMARQAVRYDDLEWLSGVRRASIKAWRRKNAPGLASIEATLGSLGYNLIPTPALQKLPPRLAGELAELASKMQADIATTWAALIDIGVEQRLLQLQADERRAILAEREARTDKTARCKPSPTVN